MQFLHAKQKLFRISFYCLLGCLLGVLVINQALAQKDIPQKERTFRWKLKNGMTVVLKEKKDVPMIAMQVLVQAGSITEGQYMGSGLSHYFEHMLGKKTKNRATEEYYNDIRRMGGVDVNAYTTYDRTVYHFTIHKEYLYQGIEALSDMLQNSIFNQKESQKEIGVILKEMNMREDNSDRYLWQQLVSTVFQVHPYKHPIIGYKNLFQRLTKKHILEYYKTMYSPDNMILVLVGNFNIEKALNKIKKTFKRFQRKNQKPIYIPQETKQLSMRKIVKRFGISEAKMTLGFPTTNILSEDAHTLEILAITLGLGKTSRLYQLLKEKNELVNQVQAFSWLPKNGSGIFQIVANLKSKHTNQVKNLIMQAIQKVQKLGITNQELQRAKKKVKLAWINRMQSLTSQARSLGYGEFLGDIYFEKKYIQGFEMVNPEDIKRVANQYLQKTKLNWVTLLPKKELLLNKKKTIFKKTEIETDQITQKQNHQTSGIEKITLNNGMKLLLKVDKTIPLVAVHGVLQGGYAYENLKNQGIHNVLTKGLLRGTKTKSAEKIAELLADIGGEIWSNGKADFLDVDGKFLKESFQKGFELYMELLSDSIFHEKEIRKIKKDIQAQINQRDDDIWLASRFHLRKVRFQNQAYGYDNLGTKSSLTNIHQEKLLNLYNNIITPDNLVLTIIGDFDKNWLLQFLQKNRNFNQRKVNIKTLDKIKPIQNIVQETYYKNDSKKQSIIKVMFDGTNQYSQDKYPLVLLSYIFTGIGSRLFIDLRGKTSLAYASGGFYNNSLELGFFYFYIATEPDKKKEALDLLFNNIKLVKKKPISQKELEIAKNSAISSMIKSLETILGKARLYGRFEILGLGYEYYLEWIENIKQVTQEDIKKVAQKYFNLNQYVLSIVESKQQNQ